MAAPMPTKPVSGLVSVTAKRRNGLALTTIVLSLVPFVLWGLLYLINVVIIGHLILTSPFSELPTLQNIVTLVFLVTLAGSLGAGVAAIVTGSVTLRRSRLHPLRRLWMSLVVACIVIDSVFIAIPICVGAALAFFALACSGPNGC